MENETVEFNFGVGHQLLGKDSLPPFEVLVEYEDIEGRKHHSSHTIDVKELAWQPANTPTLTKIATGIEKIQKAMERGGSSSNPSYVVTETYEKKRERDQTQYEEFQKRMRKEMGEK